jgi:hypothetical protein
MSNVIQKPDCMKIDYSSEGMEKVMINLNYETKPKENLLVFFLISIGTQIIAYQVHEFGHYLVGMILGVEQRFMLTGVMHGELTSSNQALYSLAGPAITFVLAIVSLILLMSSKKSKFYLLSFIYANTLLRIQPMVDSLISKNIQYQDEYKIAKSIGISGQLLCIISLVIFSGIFATAIYYSGKKKLLKIIVFIFASGVAAVIINSLGSMLFY